MRRLTPGYGVSEALRLDPESGAAPAADAIVKFCLGWDFAAAERSFQAFLDRDPQDPVSLEWYTRFLSVTGRFDEAMEQWRRIAELLEEAFAARDRSLPWINMHPWFDDLRPEPRFVALLDRLGLS